MAFPPENAREDFHRKVKELWNIPRKMYYLLINGAHEAVAKITKTGETSVMVKIKGLPGGTKPQEEQADPNADRIRIHLKTEKKPEYYVFYVAKDAEIGHISDLAEDVFGKDTEVNLYQDKAMLDIADSVSEWLTSTGGKAEATLGADMEFEEDDKAIQIPVMETRYEGRSRRVKQSPDWRKIVTEQHGLEQEDWRFNRTSQEWEEGVADIILTKEAPSDEEKSQGQEDTASTVTDNEPQAAEKNPEGNSKERAAPTPPEKPTLEGIKWLNIAIQLLGKDYEIQCSTEGEMWRQLRSQTTVRGMLYLTADEGGEAKFENLKMEDTIKRDTPIQEFTSISRTMNMRILRQPSPLSGMARQRSSDLLATGNFGKKSEALQI
jgi:hypothetical protein